MEIPSKIAKSVRERKIEVVDLRFADPKGVWQHASAPIQELETLFKKGMGFDGSSIKGFQNIYDSDLLLMLDPDTGYIDPFLRIPTLVFIADVIEPETRKRYTRDPRFIAEKAEVYLKESGIADLSYWGPEAEFFVFSHISFTIEPQNMSFIIDSPEAAWKTGDNNGVANLGYKIPNKSGYFPVPPMDSLQDMRSEMVGYLTNWGVETEMHHHEVASAGQCEIDMKYDSLKSMADKLMIYKYVVRNTANKYGMTANFMPKPLYGDNGSGMHVHNSLWRSSKNLFYGQKDYAQLSELGHYYIGGILTHIESLLSFCAPTTNSYRRLVPHFEAPVNVAFSKRNRSAIIRIPMYYSGKENAASKRIEFRAPDPTANPYLAFSAILLAGLDGIKRKISPVKKGYGPLDKNIWELTGAEKRHIRSVPGSLEESLRALERDNSYLLESGVFTEDVLSMWISLKREEIKEVALRLVTYEFYLYSAL